MPREYWWTRVDEWPLARRGGADDIAALVQELHATITLAGQRCSVRPSESA